MRISHRSAAILGSALVAVALVTAVAGAQDNRMYPRFRFGVAAGANIADMTKTTGADTRTGVIAGATMNARFTKYFSVQPEIYYAQKGVKGTFVDDAGDPIDITLKNDYVELPLLARWTLLTEGTVQPFVLGGPAFAASTSCKAEGRSGGVSASIDCDQFAKLNNFDVGGAVGGGVEFPVTHNALSLGARYTFGFSKVFDGTNSKNRTWSLLVGFVF